MHGIRCSSLSLPLFFVVGIFRIVEFKAAGIDGLQRKILIPLHILGCAAFSATMVLLGTGMDQTHKTLMTSLFFSAVLILFPIQIYVGIKRKIRISHRTPK